MEIEIHWPAKKTRFFSSPFFLDPSGPLFSLILPPKDDEEDYSLDIWAGVQPLKIVRMPVVSDLDLKQGLSIPGYLK